MAPLRHILHVDDEPDIREIVRVALEILAGFDVTQCGSGYEAIEKAADARPDMIILDVMMPGLDGLETFKRLREIEALSDTPIVFMTARMSHTNFENLYALGAAAVLIKPFDPIALPDQLKDIWAKAQEGR